MTRTATPQRDRQTTCRTTPLRSSMTWRQPTTADSLYFGLTSSVTVIAAGSVAAAMVALMVSGLPYGLVGAALICVLMPRGTRRGYVRAHDLWRWRTATRRERVYLAVQPQTPGIPVDREDNR